MRDSHAVVLVLGDVGRSPRMQYHAVSLIEQKVANKVSLVGYSGERCIPKVVENPAITTCLITPYDNKNIKKNFYVVFAAIKVLTLLLQLFWLLLFKISKPDIIVVQNPPSIPGLFIVWLVCILRRSKMCIDWHNLGFSMLGCSLGYSHPMVKICRFYEKFVGRMSDLNFCVTNAMKDWLKREFNITATVLHDRPPTFFCPTSDPEKHKLFKKLGPQLKDLNSDFLDICNVSKEAMEIGNESLLTLNNGKLRKERPVIIVSSTSWTEDEDFSILLHAIIRIDSKVKQLPVTEFPPLLFIITGKGPQKAMYLKKIEELDLSRTAVTTMWLEAEDYPKLIGCADLGVCLHTSTSGIDLPMKVVDMFGCEVPVCAVKFECLSELVHHGKNGLIFTDTDELTEQLFDLLHNYRDSNKNNMLNELRDGVRGGLNWDKNWELYAKPFLLETYKTKKNESSMVIKFGLGLFFAYIIYLKQFKGIIPASSPYYSGGHR